MEDTVTMLDQNAVEARRKLRNGAQRTSDCWETALGGVLDFILSFLAMEELKQA